VTGYMERAVGSWEAKLEMYNDIERDRGGENDLSQKRKRKKGNQMGKANVLKGNYMGSEERRYRFKGERGGGRKRGRTGKKETDEKKRKGVIMVRGDVSAGMGLGGKVGVRIAHAPTGCGARSREVWKVKNHGDSTRQTKATNQNGFCQAENR